MPSTSTSTTTSVFETRESQVRSYCREWPAVFTSAQGVYQYAEDGSRYIDFFSGAGALNYGHNHPELKRHLIDYLAGDGVTHSLDTYTVAKREFLETFEEVVLAPRGLDYVVQFPGPTGTNSVETALKIARKCTGRQDVVSFTNAFHGMTLGSLAVTGNSMKRAGAGTPLYHSSTAPYDDYFDGETPDFMWLERTWSDSGSGLDLPAAVIVETVQGEGGLKAARGVWLRELAALCRRHDVLLIVDDVQAGCGRTGRFFSFEEAGIVPDIVCLSKSISGYGLPMSLTLMRRDLDQWEPGEHNGTFRGHNPAFVTATAALRTFWTDGAIEQNVAARAHQLRDGLQRIIARSDGATLRGRGLLAGVAFEDVEVAGRIQAAAFERGLLVETSGPSGEVVKVMPALTITEAEMAEGLEILVDAASAVLRRTDGTADAAPTVAADREPAFAG
ncbi:diaminobutyrate--2-oxoglutarate transaminase [Luteipulveratus sp. YIM 133132]|uniref:Diaminobutyrate--2-oxoglutarate transaminase n=1 Tax=Luteipulveratus flavus TaxID=3031728 RepID=A0ABT6C7Q3_9MICO|nr:MULTISPECIES: diaminobutyrate--2-oxoglutarate transaminase [unclassified Luteipulveratus]MDE9365769.1 diaminobutyrate--2-oxoglutarate transaminase [Luteipulveratus sp. YIM 133132]MDF8264959.1 diaminobutyrate--2-oxoglutarate transaminase [Luteipulveratus sp. YIM 133296]